MRLTVTLAAALLAVPSLAGAADYLPAPPPLNDTMPEPVGNNWGGLYGGIHAGYSGTTVRPSAQQAASAVNSLVAGSTPALADTMSSNQGNFGAFVGVNWAMDDTVIGLEADYINFMGKNRPRINGIGSSATIAPFGAVTVAGTQYLSIKDMLLLKGRGGYAMGRFLPYVSIGLALADGHLGTYYSLNGPSGARLVDYGGRRKSSVLGGATVGVGLDYAVMDNVFLRAEYNYIAFADYAGAKARIHNVQAGLAVKY